LDAQPQTAPSRFREAMTILIMLSGGACLSIVVAALSPVIHEIAAHFAEGGDGKLVAQAIVTVPSLGIVVGGPISGWLVEKFGARGFLLAVLLLFSAAGSAGLYLDSATALVGTRFVLGLAVSGIVTGTITMISEHFSDEFRAKILGYQSAVGAGAGVGALLGSGLIAEAGGWRAPFVLYLAPLLLFALTLIYAPRGPGRERLRQAALRGAQAPVSAAAQWLAIARLWPFYALIPPVFVVMYLPNIQLSLLLASDGVMSPTVQSVVIAVGAGTVALGSYLYGSIRPRLGTRWTLFLFLALQGAGVMTIGFSHAVLPAMIGCGILGFGSGIANPMLTDLLLARAPAEVRGRVIGFSYTARYFGQFLNPVIVYPLSVQFGIHNAFLVVGAVMATGALIAAGWRSSAAPAPVPAAD
jgi:MFS family permease